MYNYNSVIDAAKEIGCKFSLNEPMLKHTTFKIGGPVDLFINVNTKEKLRIILKAINESKIPLFILGNGSNILVSDSGIRGIVLKLDGDFTKVSFLDDNCICCGSGVTLAKLCSESLKSSLSGLEFAWGIPGSVGGAVFMNAGAYSGEMQDVVVSGNHIDGLGNLGTLKNIDIDFSYRNSIYNKKDYIITDVTVQLKNDEYISIRNKMDEYMEKRKAKQPIEFPSAGSVFKRPKDNFAGTLIEKCGLKGKSIGGAQISSKHAGFIINKGNATCSDVLELIKLIKNSVFDKTGVLLETEIKVL